MKTHRTSFFSLPQSDFLLGEGDKDALKRSKMMFLARRRRKNFGPDIDFIRIPPSLYKNTPLICPGFAKRGVFLIIIPLIVIEFE